MDPNLQTLLDINAIQTLKAKYCKLADSLQDAQAFANLFTQDGILDEGEDGVFKGRDAILKMYQEITPYFRLNQHLVFSPIIEIAADGLNAQGEWKLLQLSTTIHPDEDKAFWACGGYQEEYVKENETWLIKKSVARVHFCNDYRTSWAEQPFAEFLPTALSRALSG